MTGKDHEITLREHVTRIGALGGKARAKSLTPKKLSAIGMKGGRVGGKAAAASMTPEERSARARKAALASAAVRQAKAEERKRNEGHETR